MPLQGTLLKIVFQEIYTYENLDPPKSTTSNVCACLFEQVIAYSEIILRLTLEAAVF